MHAYKNRRLSRLKLQFISILLLFCTGLPLLASPHTPALQSTKSGKKDKFIVQLNHLHELWSFYKYTYIKNGRVISLDENNITTSEGQGYALLRSVWANDHQTFKKVYRWTQTHLKRDQDRLFVWKYKHDTNAAADADCDIALALILAAEKFSVPAYREEALKIIHDVWAGEVIQVKRKYYLTAGNWAPQEKYPTIHVAYLAPYAYELFSALDSKHPWQELIQSSYEIWEWLYFEKKVQLPPEKIYIDKTTGKFLFRKPPAKKNPPNRFSYDAFPLYWRVAVDEIWFGRGESALRLQMLNFFQKEWHKNRKFFDAYSLTGKPLSTYEALPLYATVQSLASIDDPQLAGAIYDLKLKPLWENAVSGKATPYYLHNWLWFGRALDAQVARNYTAFLDFLKPFDYKGFYSHFPLFLLVLSILLYGSTRLLSLKSILYTPCKWAFLICGFMVCIRYLWWRINFALNFMEPWGPFISIALLLAEIYCMSTVLLLLLQVGINPRQKRKAENAQGYAPWVDIYLPIYSESIAILEKTLMAATAIDYTRKKVFILDDSHREAVMELAEQYSATYIKGPKKHAKAGNLNHALPQTQGELIVVFDTDHIPMNTFLKETVPYFINPKLGVVQTPHHFYNQDVFQRAFLCNDRIPNEQDMFNHGIQGARDNWQGSFFVGSGAVFRRTALEKIGGFKLMSVTEDIHTSQHLHADGFDSVFVDKDLAVGLTAENFSAYIIQRKRWMQGCLQVFFKNNPLFQRGLSFRHRLGYLASLYYFFFPIARVIFWVTPLYYLLFHLHPLFADVSILMAYMVPYLLCLPLLSAALLHKWPRMLWGVTYENAVSFPLFFSMFSLLLPGKLGFKVTPKGIVSDKRRFDFSSSWVTLLIAAVTLTAILKGLWEYYYFNIEKDAYLFNIAWAVYNLIFLAASILVAWERPQKREDERLNIPVQFELKASDISLQHAKEASISGRLNDISQSGISFLLNRHSPIPQKGILTLFDHSPLSLPVKRIYQDRTFFGRLRCGYRFETLSPETKKELFLRTFADSRTWEHAHANHTQSNLLMMYYFIKGIVFCFLPSRKLKRAEARYRTFKRCDLLQNGQKTPAILCNRSPNGKKFILFHKTAAADNQWAFIHDNGQVIDLKNIYFKRVFPFISRAGFKMTRVSKDKRE